MTPGCETQPRRFRDLYDQFQEHDIAVVGISPDPVEKLAGFVETETLPFPLLSDTGAEVAEAYESHGERRMRGVLRKMTLRNSYLVGPDGRIESTYESVMPYDHPPEVLEDVADRGEDPA